MPKAQNSTETIALVFTDLVGSTELMSQLEAERADRVRRDHFARLQASVDDKLHAARKDLDDRLPGRNDAADRRASARTATPHDIWSQSVAGSGTAGGRLPEYCAAQAVPSDVG